MASNRYTNIQDVFRELSQFFQEEAAKAVRDAAHKTLVIYGAGARGVMAFRALESLGVQTSFFIDSDIRKHGRMLCGIPIKSLDCLDSGRSSYRFILAADYPDEMETNLSRIGVDTSTQVKRFFDHGLLSPAIPLIAPMTAYDPLLGFNRIPSAESAFRSLSTESREKPLRILVMGNSTTDPEVQFPTPGGPTGRGSWPLFLFEEFKKRGLPVSIQNEALSAYTSSQELFKLIRDILPLRPDLVVVYSGINDVSNTYWFNGKRPKIHAHFNKLETPLRDTFKNTHIPSIASPLPMDSIYLGLEPQSQCPEEWEQNVRMMHAICAEFNIQFIYILQPGGLYHRSYIQSCDVQANLLWVAHDLLVFWGHHRMMYESKHPDKKLEDQSIDGILKFYLDNLFRDGSDSEKTAQSFDLFYEEASRLAKQHSFIVDMSQIMHGIPDVFHDGCHCNTKGNQIIATKIFDEIIKIKNRCQ